MVAVVFHRLGPYHKARLQATATLPNPIIAIEGCRVDRVYAWDAVAHAERYPVHTLFAGDCEAQPFAEVQRRFDNVMDAARPRSVALPGWAGKLSLAAVDWCSRNGVPAIVMSESTAHDEVRRPCKEWVKRRLVRMHSAALVGGRAHADYIVQLGMPRERVFPGYDAVDNAYFAQETKKRRAEGRSQYNLPEKYFLASARFIPKKNLPRLMQAYAGYRRKAASRKQQAEIWDLVLLGDGELGSMLQGLRSMLGLDAHVHMPGFKQYPELPTYYGFASAFVHASTTEQWGLVVNEAMASGLPVMVSNRCGCAPDLVREGVNGFTFDPLNVEQMVELMLRVAGMDEAKRREMGAKSQELIADWGPERFEAGLQGAVETALRVPRPRATGLDRVLLKMRRLQLSLRTSAATGGRAARRCQNSRARPPALHLRWL